MLEAYAPTAVSIGRPQDALDALAAYPATGSKPALLLARARANEAAHKHVSRRQRLSDALLQISSRR